MKLSDIRTMILSQRAQNNPVQEVTITLNTRVPVKWAALDLETGDVWWTDPKTGQFKRVED